jgi:hypothetical protein
MAFSAATINARTAAAASCTPRCVATASAAGVRARRNRVVARAAQPDLNDPEVQKRLAAMQEAMKRPEVQAEMARMQQAMQSSALQQRMAELKDVSLPSAPLEDARRDRCQINAAGTRTMPIHPLDASLERARIGIFGKTTCGSGATADADADAARSPPLALAPQPPTTQNNRTPSSPRCSPKSRRAACRPS